MASDSATDVASNVEAILDAADTAKSERSLWKIEDIRGKGKGVIATNYITPGTILMNDAPLITTDCITSTETTERDLARAFNSLPKESQKRFSPCTTTAREKILSAISSDSMAYP